MAECPQFTTRASAASFLSHCFAMLCMPVMMPTATLRIYSAIKVSSEKCCKLLLLLLLLQCRMRPCRKRTQNQNKLPGPTFGAARRHARHCRARRKAICALRTL